MKRLAMVLLAIVLGGMMGVGCGSPPPPRVGVPPPRSGGVVREYDAVKPLPEPAEQRDPRIAEDVMIVKQRLPGEARFVDAYNRVGRPRIAVFVNRTLEGQVLPVNPEHPVVSVQHARSTATGPGVDRQTVDVYLRPGQYDEVAAKSLDYEAMENILTDWIACNGQVEVISPTMARGKLSDEQIKALESGRPQVMSEIARQLEVDVLIQAQVHPTRQTQAGLEMRVVAEAISLRGGQSIGRVVVDFPPPMDKPRLNYYTRFLASKVMDDMTESWAGRGLQQMPPQTPVPIPSTQPGER